ncbi:MAG: TlyA family RNA methyltransferase [Microbacteriaceae bacterium]
MNDKRAGTTRVDTALVERGLARSRRVAARLIAEGVVSEAGTQVLKPSQRVRDDQQLVVTAGDRYVSRAAHKLIAALDAFPVPTDGVLALDLGASTGGFSQVLLERGAARVIAVDVGHGQLSSTLVGEPRLISIEGFNVRYMTRASLTAASGVDVCPTLVVGDLSFISLITVLPAIRAVAPAGADVILLVKPQFEVGRTRVGEGVVHSPVLRADAVSSVVWAAWDLHLGTAGMCASPIVGTHGNQEYLVWLSADGGTDPTQWRDRITTMVGA